MEAVCPAGNGAEVAANITRSSPNLLLPDIRMPVMSGLEVLQQRQRQYSTIPTIILTPFDDEPVLGACRPAQRASC